MFPKTFVFISLVLFCFPVSSFSNEGGKSTGKEFVLVGRFEDKMYFTETTHMSWMEADEYCRANDMNLVSASSQEELDYLVEENDDAGNPRWWTSGRDANVFKWANGDNIVSTVHLPYLGCVLIQGRLYVDPCDGLYNNNTYHPLCEVTTA